MAYSDDYVGLYTAIMSASMDTDSPYDKTVAKIIDFYEQREMTEELKAQYFTQYMSNITTGITTQAMNIALQATDRASLLPHQTTKARAEAEIADDTDRKEAVKDKPAKENLILDAQYAKLTEETEYVDLQGQALMAQVDDNRKIKALESLASILLGMATETGTVVNSTEWATFASLLSSTAKGIDISASIGTSTGTNKGQMFLLHGNAYSDTEIGSVLGKTQAEIDASGVSSVHTSLQTNKLADGTTPTEGDNYFVAILAWRHIDENGVMSYYQDWTARDAADTVQYAEAGTASAFLLNGVNGWLTGDKMVADANLEWTFYSKLGL